jgi:hypothetical protein
LILLFFVESGKKYSCHKQKRIELGEYKICAENCNGDPEIIKQEERDRSGRNKACTMDTCTIQ